jgi:hypothetical protein
VAPHNPEPVVFDPENPERRAFTLASIFALLGGVTITVTGCGDSYSAPGSPAPPPGGATGTVSVNHGHTATITSAQLNGTSAVTLQIRGTATHPHTVEVTAQELSQIAAGQRVSKTSSTDNSPDAGVHSHVVTFN